MTLSFFAEHFSPDQPSSASSTRLATYKNKKTLKKKKYNLHYKESVK